MTYGFGSLKNALKIAANHLDFCCVTGHAMWPDMYERSPETEFIVDFHNNGFAKLRRDWNSIRETIAQANTAGLVTFQSYEMHSSLYGDHHLVSPDDGLLLVERDTPEELVKSCGARAIAIPHHIGYTPGYRGINWDLYQAGISPCVEVFSKHGCNMNDTAPYPYYHDMGPRDPRNTVYEGMRRGNRFSFLGSTDHHAGFPGSYGDGLTAVLAEEKSRESIWKALLEGRTYAVTGDRIECDFTVNGQGLGETVRGSRRRIRCRICGEYAADKLVIYKNRKPLKVICGEELKPNESGRYKLRLEMGWGNSEELTTWLGRISTTAKIVSSNVYWRGRSLLSPTNHDGSQTVVNDIDNRVLLNGPHEFEWKCETVRNKSTLHPQTDSVVLELEGPQSSEILLRVNDVEKRTTIGELLRYGMTWHVKPYHSEAVKVHTLQPEYQYCFEACCDDVAELDCDVYHAEFAQKNGQWAFISPIYAEK